MRRLRFRLLPLLAAMVTLAALTVVQAGPASANESAPTLSPAQGPVGTRVTADASDWIGCTSMSVSGWGSTLATTSINSSGAFSLSFTVPASAPGDQQLQFSPTCSHSTWMPFVTFKVTSGSPDTSAPSVSWTSPVGNSGTFPVSSGSVTLQASASDNVGVARVKFTRWDAVAVKWVDLATVSSAPWQTTLAVSTLNSGYNQVNVQAWDAAGNASTSPYIWLNRSTPTPAWWSGDCDVNSNPGSYALGTSFNGVKACGPGPTQGGTDHLVRFFTNAFGEYEWECVELVMRYMYLAYGIAPYNSPGGRDVVANYTGNALIKVNNSGASLPTPGDILSFAASTNHPKLGHTAVVTSVSVNANGSGSVATMEQNASAKGSGSVVVSAKKLGDGVTGWLHNPNSGG